MNQNTVQLKTNKESFGEQYSLFKTLNLSNSWLLYHNWDILHKLMIWRVMNQMLIELQGKYLKLNFDDSILTPPFLRLLLRIPDYHQWIVKGRTVWGVYNPCVYLWILSLCENDCLWFKDWWHRFYVSKLCKDI